LLVAQNSKNEYIHLASQNWTKDQLQNLKKEDSFQCPACKSPVKLKAGKVRIPHFAHISNQKCLVDSEPESMYHLKGKVQLFHWLKKQEIPCELEKYFPSIKQRADLFVDKYPIEYQCSQIPVEQIQARTRGYQNENNIPIWILGSKLLSRNKSMEYRLTPFHWQFTRLDKEGQPFLLTYCSSLQSFILLQKIIPFTKQIFFAETTLFPLNQLTISQILIPPKLCPSAAFYQMWLKKVHLFRQTPKSFRSKREKMLQSLIYESYGIPLTLLPSEAFIPLKEGWKIEEAVYVWQSLVLVTIEKLQDKVFHLRKIKWYLNRYVGTLVTRQEDMERVLKQYLDFLVKVKLLDSIGPFSYRKKMPIFRQQHIEQLMKNDIRLKEMYS